MLFGAEIWFYKKTKYDQYCPTLTFIHRFNDIVPYANTALNTVSYILNGADVMAPGIRGFSQESLPIGSMLVILSTHIIFCIAILFVYTFISQLKP